MPTPKAIRPQADKSGYYKQSDPLVLIDRAVAASKEAAHACHNEAARLHFEFALALLRESWIAESGQNALPAETVIENVRKGLRLIEFVFRNNTTKPLELSE